MNRFVVLRLALAAAGIVVASTFVGVTAAAAQDYPGGKTEERVDATEANREPEVLGVDLERPAVAPTSVSGNQGVLPVTGGDVAGLAGIGVGLVAVGAVVTRRTRRPAAA